MGAFPTARNERDLGFKGAELKMVTGRANNKFQKTALRTDTMKNREPDFGIRQ